jgi:outer membrane receptor protein involved in Fe transport
VREKWEHEISGAYDINDSINIYAGINNLLDAKPAFEYSSYPVSAMGRYYYLGARMNFGGAAR